MKNLSYKIGMLKRMTKTLALTIAVSLMIAPSMVLAKRGGDDRNRSEFYGIVEFRPEYARQGEWVIGGYTFIADAETELDQSEGPLTIGSCVKVHLRDGRVHEIDSEPMRNCR